MSFILNINDFHFLIVMKTKDLKVRENLTNGTFIAL